MVAAALSHPSYVPSSPLFPVSAVCSLPSASPGDFSKLSSLQQSCPETSALLSNPSYRVVSKPYRDSSILCDLSTGLPRPLVPVSLTLVFVLPGSWFLVPLFGLGSPKMSPTGPEDVYIVCGVRFNNLFTPLSLRFLFLLDHSVRFRWTWLGLFLVLEVLLISSPSWTRPRFARGHSSVLNLH